MLACSYCLTLQCMKSYQHAAEKMGNRNPCANMVSETLLRCCCCCSVLSRVLDAQFSVKVPQHTLSQVDIHDCVFAACRRALAILLALTIAAGGTVAGIAAAKRRH